MANVAADKPRKVYCRQGIVHVCYKGKLYAPGNLELESTNVRLEFPLKSVDEVEPVYVDGEERACVKVYQPVPKKKSVTEFWYEVCIPPKRAKKAKARPVVLDAQKAA